MTQVCQRLAKLAVPSMKQTLGVENLPRLPQMQSGGKSLGMRPGSEGAKPAKSGCVWMVQNVAGRAMKIRIVLNVHQTTFGRYAVVSQDKVLCKDSGFINLNMLKAREVKEMGGSGVRVDNCHRFQLIPYDGDGSVLTFAVKTSQELVDWLDILNSPEEEDNSTGKSLSSVLVPPQRRKSSSSYKLEATMPALIEEGIEE